MTHNLTKAKLPQSRNDTFLVPAVLPSSEWVPLLSEPLFSPPGKQKRKPRVRSGSD